MDPNDFGDMIETAYSRISSSARKAITIGLVAAIPLVSGCSSFYTQLRPPHEERSEEKVAVVKEGSEATNIETIVEEDDSKPHTIGRFDRTYGYSYFEDDYLAPRVGDFDNYIYHSGYDSRYGPYNYISAPWGYGYPIQYGYGGYSPYNYGYDPYYRGSDGTPIPLGYELIRTDELERLNSYQRQQQQKPQLSPEQLRQQEQHQREQQREVWQMRINPYKRKAPQPTIRETAPPDQPPPENTITAPANKTSEDEDERRSAVPKRTAPPKRTRR